MLTFLLMESLTETVSLVMFSYLLVTDISFIQHSQNVNSMKTHITEAFEHNRKMSVLTCPLARHHQAVGREGFG